MWYATTLQVRMLTVLLQYSINKSKVMLGFVGPQWEQHIVAELDSALNKWIDSVPDHRKFRPGYARFLNSLSLSSLGPK